MYVALAGIAHDVKDHGPVMLFAQVITNKDGSPGERVVMRRDTDFSGGSISSYTVSVGKAAKNEPIPPPPALPPAKV